MFVPPEKLRPAPWNPPLRGSLRDKDLLDLQDSLIGEGQLKPITICYWPHSRSLMLIDGMRRTMAGLLWNKEAGRKNEDRITLRAEFFDVDGDMETAKRMYAHINKLQKKFSMNDFLGIWLMDRKAVDVDYRQFFANQVEIFGLAAVRRVYEHGRSSAIFGRARNVANAAGKGKDRDTLVTLLDWMLEHKVSSVVRDAMTIAPSNANLIIKAARKEAMISIGKNLKLELMAS